MAHKGKTWRLAFRRDFNLNVLSNQHQWAARYDVTLQLLPFGNPTTLNGSVWVCGPSTMADDHTMSWLSDGQIHDGYEWKIELRDEIRDGPAEHRRTVRYIRTDAGIAATVAWDTANPYGNLWSNTGGGTLIQYRADLFPTGARPSSFTFNPVVYAAE